jgi:hypothetical protein
MEVESAPPSLQYDCFPGTTLTKNLAQKSRKRKSEGKHKRTRFPAIRCSGLHFAIHSARKLSVSLEEDEGDALSKDLGMHGDVS